LAEIRLRHLWHLRAKAPSHAKKKPIQLSPSEKIELRQVGEITLLRLQV
jgi:hypothetical protein